jgi:hypothetical protein
MSSSARGEAEQRIGRVLRRRWTLEQVIGVGGTAAVYAATHRNGSRVAIKVLHPSLQADAGMVRRFLQEGYLANRIGVPDVVKVLDDDFEGDIAYLVMELLEGASIEVLRERAGGRLAAADVIDIAYRLLTVLEAAHACGVVHRDIKPANLFRTTDPVGFKVLDFGIAKLAGAGSAPDDTGLAAGGFVGTPGFMAPEQARGQKEQLDARTDLWAVGATLFTLLTGQYVHPGSTASEILLRASERPAPALAEQLRGVPTELGALVDRALAFEQGARFQSASDMKRACEDCRVRLAARGEHGRFFGAPLRARTRSAPPPRDEGAGSPPEAADSAVVRVTGAEPRAGFWSGRVGRLWWFHYTGPCTDETWRQYLALVGRMVDSGRDSSLVFFAHHAGAPGAVQRKELADFVQKNMKALERLDRFALVIDSVVHRGALTAINWLVKKPFEERVFNSPLSAIKWLTEKHPELEPEAVRMAIASQVPRHSLWSALASQAPETIAKSAS